MDYCCDELCIEGRSSPPWRKKDVYMVACRQNNIAGPAVLLGSGYTREKIRVGYFCT